VDGAPGKGGGEEIFHCLLELPGAHLAPRGPLEGGVHGLEPQSHFPEAGFLEERGGLSAEEGGVHSVRVLGGEVEG